MENTYRQAFTEVLEVLEHTSKTVLEKIPERFINFLKNNKDNEYTANIDFSKVNWEEDVKEETKLMIALIYRDYIVSPEQRNKLIQEEKEEQIRLENETREKYNPDNIFKNNKEDVDCKNTNLPVEIKKDTVFRKIVIFIKKLLFKKI